jgi:hypothetical protein
MGSDRNGRLLIAWLALVGVTLLSWRIGAGENRGVLRLNTMLTCGVLLISAVKVRLIIREFMEVGQAPSLLRRLSDGVMLLAFAIMIGIYYFGIGVKL